MDIIIVVMVLAEEEVAADLNLGDLVLQLLMVVMEVLVVKQILLI